MKLLPFFFVLLYSFKCESQELYKRCGWGSFVSNVELKYEGKNETPKWSLKSNFNNNTIKYDIPLVFHFILNQQQINKLGGLYGIKQRVLKQIAVINDAFQNNKDTALIPLAFRHLTGSVDIHFQLARVTPDNQETDGIEIKVTTQNGISSNGITGSGIGFSDVKYNSSLGLSGWDPMSYINVWVINPLADNNGFNYSALTISPLLLSEYKSIPFQELGIVMHYGTLGSRSDSSEFFLPKFDKGKTLIHELGHFFGLKHIWGDDNGKCLIDGGADDDIEDTPIQANSTSGCPSFPKYDKCTSNKSGIMFMNYMDYTDDDCSLMFTKGQCDKISTNIYSTDILFSLTQHPNITANNNTNINYLISPNPCKNKIYIIFTQPSLGLKKIELLNSIGQNLDAQIITSQRGYYNFEVSQYSNQMLFIKLVFDNKVEIKKILKNE
ncbi:MAG: hypothetical protein J0L80_15795 [Chitinophagales bacterium]|nr:hypothetical protein [Chitinophagales bacterium]